ncbi:MAG: hypothetical protein ACKO0Z_21330 [Betaproteobacteria bacterium]
MIRKTLIIVSDRMLLRALETACDSFTIIKKPMATLGGARYDRVVVLGNPLPPGVDEFSLTGKAHLTWYREVLPLKLPPGGVVEYLGWNWNPEWNTAHS